MQQEIICKEKFPCLLQSGFTIWSMVLCVKQVIFMLKILVWDVVYVRETARFLP